MISDHVRDRIRHPAVLTFLLGGVSGSAINFSLTVVLHYVFHLHPAWAFFCGTLGNQLFHHVYYHLVFINQEVRMRAPLVARLVVYVLVAFVAAGLIWGLMKVGLSFLPAVILALVILAVGNVLLVRITTFTSATLAEVEYREMNETFYDDQTDTEKVNWFRAWFHRSRFAALKKFVAEHGKPGMTVADLGCGNAWWNEPGPDGKAVDVTGVDINEKMLSWAKRHGRLTDYRVTTSLTNTGLPEKSFDVVITSEVLEHLLDLEHVLAEVRRVLKDDGVYLITVPWDFFMGPFFVLFNVNCLYQGFIKGSHYHRLRCGHINHFTKARLRRLLKANGFDVRGIRVVNGMSLYAVATKT
jgi:2-polyprenyl-3-methyl-5-hydroxy-6-metoxy-1,4-benzoquinol methylase